METRSWWHVFSLRLKVCSNITALIAIELLLILIVLKLGDTQPFGRWTWTLVVVPPVVGAIVCLSFGRCVHYYSCRDYQYLSSLRASSDLGTTYLLHLDVERLENYHENALFRDVLLGIGYAVFIGLSINLYAIPCHGCRTPYDMLGIGIIVTYGARFLLLLYHNAKWYLLMRQLCRELRKYQSFFDDHRLFQSVLPDLYVRTRSRWLDGFLFVATLVLASLASIWVQHGNCASICNRVVKCSSYLLGGIYILECFYMVSEVILTYLHRIQGMENVHALIKRAYKDRQAAKRETLLDAQNKGKMRAQ